jgi:hypothetical protein
VSAPTLPKSLRAICWVRKKKKKKKKKKEEENLT